MNKLYKLLKEYDNILLDKKFIEKAFDYYLEEDSDLKDYVCNIKVTDNDEDSNIYGNYRMPPDKLVTIYINNIINKNVYSDNINRKNIFALEALKHEITHAKQLKRIDEGRKNINTEVNKLSLLNYCSEKGFFYPLPEYDMQYINFLTNENYEISPDERSAEITSWKYIVNLLKNKRRSDELLFAKTNLFYSYIRGYKDNGIYINCPTYEFLIELRLMREFKLLKKKVESNNYNLETRLKNGLPITQEEYNNEILKRLQLTKRK